MNFMNFEVQCPHCNEYLIIEKVNCAIFRHGVVKTTMRQINPHLSKPECDKLKDLDLIYGCGKPFKLEWVNKKEKEEEEEGRWICVECDYI